MCKDRSFFSITQEKVCNIILQERGDLNFKLLPHDDYIPVWPLKLIRTPNTLLALCISFKFNVFYRCSCGIKNLSLLISRASLTKKEKTHRLKTSFQLRVFSFFVTPLGLASPIPFPATRQSDKKRSAMS